MSCRIHVAVAVVFNSKGQVLWAQRPQGKPYANYWEFPGGKVEANESIWQALVRELKEELDLDILEGGPWFVIDHDYEHAKVRLHLYRVWKFSGNPRALEQQRFTWSSLSDSILTPILPATLPILPLFNQPQLMRITHFEAMSITHALNLFETDKEKAQWRGLRIYFREKNLSAQQLVATYQATWNWCTNHDVPLVVNSVTALLLLQAGFPLQVNTTLHLTQDHLMNTPSQLSRFKVIGASVHRPEHLAVAHAKQLTYALLGAVKATPSHPDQEGLGWTGFYEMLHGKTQLPVFAVGGLSFDDLVHAQGYGAHGIAMMRGHSSIV